MSSTIPTPPILDLASSADPDVHLLVKLYDRLRSALDGTLAKNLEKLQHEASWALLYKMNCRAMEVQSACILLYANQYFAPAEALCRTVVEASLNLYYSSLGDSCSLILSYFRSHIETERKQNKSWQSSINASIISEATKEIHQQCIRNKEEALLQY